MSLGQRLIGFGVFVLLCFSAAALGAALGGPGGSNWYERLHKPSWTPPSWAFGPAWTVLYLMMATAAWLVWRRAGAAGAPVPLLLFGLQLVFNAAWTPLFFGLKMPGAAFAEIVALWWLILATLIAFWKTVPAAGILMMPYLAWVSFAAALNFAIWRMNAGASG
ncbi:MAG: tryptophan-rich sensory protein [Armatimonadota bacterium]|nr:MAG: tryptophan-rich sensory protein [Armatimonadota bacterium]